MRSPNNSPWLPCAANNGHYHLQEFRMLVNQRIKDDLFLLGVIAHRTRGQWPNRVGYFVLDISGARQLGLTKSTAIHCEVTNRSHRAVLSPIIKLKSIALLD